MSAKLDLKGKRFGFLTALEDAGRANGYVLWRCRCDCGRESFVRSSALKRGEVESCGCKAREATVNRQTKHGKSRTRLYSIWKAMMRRCYNESTANFQIYGGRGIVVCDAWHDFLTFFSWAVANGYDDSLSIDRIDNDADYCPKNCRWATRLEQSRNIRRNIMIDGKPLSQICQERGLNYTRTYQRIKKGWSVEQALTAHFRGKHNGLTIKEICKKNNVSYNAVCKRLSRGQSLGDILRIMKEGDYVGTRD